MSFTKPLPRWKCNKTVCAVRISSIVSDADIAASEGRKETDHSSLLYHDEEGIPPVRVSRQFMYRYDPQPGGYFVVDRNGQKSYLPAEDFERDHTRISDNGC